MRRPRRLRTALVQAKNNRGCGSCGAATRQPARRWPIKKGGPKTARYRSALVEPSREPPLIVEPQAGQLNNTLRQGRHRARWSKGVIASGAGRFQWCATDARTMRSRNEAQGLAQTASAAALMRSSIPGSCWCRTCRRETGRAHGSSSKPRSRRASLQPRPHVRR